MSVRYRITRTEWYEVEVEGDEPSTETEEAAIEAVTSGASDPMETEMDIRAEPETGV